MAFKVPSLADVSRTIENGFSSAFYGKSGNLRFGVLKVFSKVVAGGCYLPILFCQYIWKNSFIETSDVDNLIRFGGWYNLPHKVATYAKGLVIVTTNENGVNVPANTYLIDENTGRKYYTTEAAQISAIGYLKVIADDVGNEYNIEEPSSVDEAIKLRFVELSMENVAGIYAMAIQGGVSVDVSVNGKTEKWGESVEDYRSRLKSRRQNQPMGGCASDYESWAKRFSCVTDCVVVPNWPSTNGVFIALSDFNNSSGVLSTDDLNMVSNYIKDESRKPITADVKVINAYPVSIGFSIDLAQDSASVKSSVVSSLKKYLRTFKPTQTITPSVVENYLNKNGIAEGCSVTQMKVSGEAVESYNLALGTNNAEVVNINYLENNVVFV